MTARSIEQTTSEIVGLQAYVSTPFDSDGDVDLRRLQEHLEWIFDPSGRLPAGCFAACGAGEVWSLDLDEYEQIVRTAVKVVDKRVPVIAGVGYGTRMARSMAQVAEEQGADGVLIFPPYLTAGPPRGLFEHYRSIAEAVDVSVLLYQREGMPLAGETILRLATIRNVVGLKDGTGDLELIDALRSELGAGFLFGNGMPVAETWAPLYLDHGVRSYSPGGIDFIPELAWLLDDALATSDQVTIERILSEFFRPLKVLRERQTGYGVSINKAALALRGASMGSVRPPLIDLLPDDLDDLQQLLERGIALAAELTGQPQSQLAVR
jgi:5-dehydro-4-deoxyglucarate dehydratase